MISKLGDFTINAFDPGEPAGYPTLCKGRFVANGKTSYLFEDPVSLNASSILPELAAAGVTGLKIEGRQRGKAYIAEVVSSFRRAVDSMADGASVETDLMRIAEGQRKTTGAYQKAWR